MVPLKEDLLNPNQSGFRPSNSCINQLLAITHDSMCEIRSTSLDISKTFGKIWHKGLLYKLKSMGILEISLIFLNIIYQVDFKELL